MVTPAEFSFIYLWLFTTLKPGAYAPVNWVIIGRGNNLCSQTCYLRQCSLFVNGKSMILPSLMANCYILHIEFIDCVILLKRKGHAYNHFLSNQFGTEMLFYVTAIFQTNNVIAGSDCNQPDIDNSYARSRRQPLSPYIFNIFRASRLQFSVMQVWKTRSEYIWSDK